MKWFQDFKKLSQEVECRKNQSTTAAVPEVNTDLSEMHKIEERQCTQRQDSRLHMDNKKSSKGLTVWFSCAVLG